MSATTNPTPAEILQDFRDLGRVSIPSWDISRVHVRALMARGMYLSGNASTSEDRDELDSIEQELAGRVFGRKPFLK